MKKWRDPTLIEVLILVTIVALLIAILMPTRAQIDKWERDRQLKRIHENLDYWKESP